MMLVVFITVPIHFGSSVGSTTDISKCTLDEELLDCSGVSVGKEGFSGEILLPLNKVIFNEPRAGPGCQ